MTSGDIKKRFLSPEQIWDALVDIAEFSDAEGLSVALVGGVALQLFGSDRLTKDVDIIASAVPRRGVAIVRHLTFGGDVIRTAKGSEVDVIVRDDDYRRLYEDALLEARPIESVPIRVATVEHIAAMKMAAARKKDEIDLEFLLRHEVLDRVRTRAIILRFLGLYAAREFDRLAAEVDWKRGAGIVE